MTTNKYVVSLEGSSDLRTRFDERRSNPIPSIERLAGDDDGFQAAALVQADVETGLGNSFQPVDTDSGFQLLGPMGVTAQRSFDGRRRFAVCWLFECRQTGPLGAVLGYNEEQLAAIQPPHPSTAEPIIIEGVTTGLESSAGSEEFQLRRYIDWSLVLAQLGVTSTLRGGDPTVRLERTLDQAMASSFSEEQQLITGS